MISSMDGSEAPVPPQEAATKFLRGPPADWVEPVEAGRQASHDAFVSWLLFDEQFDLVPPTPKRYTRCVLRANNSHGADHLAEIRIVFNPSYETLTLHHVSVTRAGRTFDALEDADIDFLRIEHDMYARVYRGDYAVVVQIRGLEAEDEVDYAYTIDGVNPALGGKMVFAVHHSFEQPLARRFFRTRLDAGSGVTLQHKGPSVPMETRDVEAFIENRVDLFEVPRWDFEYWVPAEADHQSSMTCMSSFNAWPDVGTWAAGLCAVPDDTPVAALTERFMSGPTDPVLAAVAFVQERIRYVSTNFGQGGYRPRALDVILKRMYGDCKDKALLLVTVLRRMGHTADLALVNTHAPRGPVAALPTPSAFNHMIVRAVIDGETHWIDATTTGQRGPLGKRGRPHSMAALIVAHGMDGLVDIPPLESSLLGHFSDGTINVSGGPGQPVRLSNEGVAIGIDAENIRRSVAVQGVDGMRRYYEETESQQHGEVVCELFEVIDDEEDNRVRVNTVFNLVDPWRPAPDGTSSFRSILCYGTDLVPIIGTKQRQLPMRMLEHPLHHMHRETILLPPDRMPIDLKTQEIGRQNSGFLFSRRQTLTGNTLKLEVETRTLAAKLPAGEALEAIRDQTALKDAHVLTLTFAA